MLDRMSRGRFLFGFGRGISPSELRYFSIDAATVQQKYDELLDIILKAFAAEGEFAYDGEFYKVSRIPMNIRPYQLPHPPLWYGMHSPESAIWAAGKQVNFITLGSAEASRVLTDRYRAEWAKLGEDPARLPLLGVGRHVVIAPTDGEARAIARRAYPKWRDSFWYTRRREGDEPPVARSYPPDFDELQGCRPRLRRLAGGGPRLDCAPDREDRRQLLRLVARLRRHDPGRGATLGRALYGRGHAELSRRVKGWPRRPSAQQRFRRDPCACRDRGRAGRIRPRADPRAEARRDDRADLGSATSRIAERPR